MTLGWALAALQAAHAEQASVPLLGLGRPPLPAAAARLAPRLARAAKLKGMPLDVLHPLVARWFREKFGQPTEPQQLGWPAIQAGRNTLIAAPTGSGKTLAAFLVCLDRLLRSGLDGDLPDGTQVVYVSPLKALSNDIHRNLEVPLAELRGLAESEGLRWPEIRIGVRTGDTPAAARAAMLRRPPHILVTTPESLYLLLTSERGRQPLRAVETVIVDEIHALARDKRGSHLTLTLERLEAWCARPPVRIGLSATQRPLDEIARFLVGAAGRRGRNARLHDRRRRASAHARSGARRAGQRAVGRLLE